MDRCDAKCLVPLYDRCLEWTGPSISCIGVTHGEFYDSAIIKLANTLCDHINREVSLECLYDNTCGKCEPSVKIPEAVQIIIDKICNLTTSDINHLGGLYCLGINTMSAAAVNLLNKKLTYSVSTHPTEGSTLSYNLIDDLNSLDQDFVVSRINSVVTGTPNRGVTTIIDSDKGHVSATVKNDRFPLNAKFEVYVNTPSGTVKLYKNINLSSPELINQATTFEIDDYSTSSSKSYSQYDVNTLMASEICSHRNQLDAYKYVDVQDGECLKFPSKDIKDVVGVLAGGVEDLCARVGDLEMVIIRDCDECGETSKEVTIQEAIDILADKNCEQDEEIKKLKEEIETLKKAISAISASALSNNAGGCPDGNCS